MVIKDYILGINSFVVNKSDFVAIKQVCDERGVRECELVDD